jgi:hypothetical protein
LMYPLTPDNMWSLSRGHSNSAFLDRVTFGVWALLFLLSVGRRCWYSAYLSTITRTLSHPLTRSLLFVKPIRHGEKLFLQTISKWGLAASAIAFTLGLQDSIAEISAGISFRVWLAVNLPRFVRSQGIA